VRLLVLLNTSLLHPKCPAPKVSLFCCISLAFIFAFLIFFSTTKEYGYGTIAVVIVSLLALIGIILLPCFRRSLYDDILMMLTALAVSALFCDVMFHILPEIFSIHGHEENREESKIRVPDFSFKIIGAVFGNFFYLF